jgi:hypothetical protein
MALRKIQKKFAERSQQFFSAKTINFAAKSNTCELHAQQAESKAFR